MAMTRWLKGEVTMAFHFETANPGEVMPARIGPYKIISKLGGGGFGNVYFVRRDGSDSPLALKVLATANFPRQFRDQALRRFQSEALVSNQINHPGVVKAFDADCDENGNYYIAMEYLAGVSFKKHFESKREAMARGCPTDPTIGEVYREIAFLSQQIAAAMIAAHHEEVYHRDLKPENVMVVEDPFALKQRRIKVFDFGIAKFPPEIFTALAKPANFTPHWTREGTPMGTPPYMAPEQWLHAEKANGEADVYALGIMLYEVLAWVDTDKITTPPIPIRELMPSIPQAWSDLVTWMTAEQAQRRPKMAEVAQRLQALAQEYDEFATAVLAWEQSGRRAFAVGHQLHQFLGWSQGKHLTEGESEFLRASAVTNAEFERQASAARLKEEQRIARAALDAEHQQRIAAETQLQADATLRAAAEERERVQRQALVAQKRVRNLLVAVSILLGIFLAFAVVQRNSALAEKDKAERAQSTATEATGKLVRVETAKAKADADLNAADNAIKDANKDIAAIRKSKLSADEQLAKMQSTVDKLSATANNLSNVRRNLEIDINILKNKNDELRQQGETLRGERDAARVRVVALESELPTRVQERDAARVRVAALESELPTRVQERDAARVRVAALDAQLQEANGALAATRAQLTECRQPPPVP
jgi:tRNA A-37 threonylcarbamoyl transferase component Bud32